MKPVPQNIIISRTDSIGDVILTLPVAAVLKRLYPAANIGFIGKSYTRPVILACKNVDEFIDWEDFLNREITVCGNKPDAIVHVFPDAAIARKAREIGIRWRIGTTNRLYHWFTCNKLVKLSRRHSHLHEAQLNLRLLKPFGYTPDLSLVEIAQLFGMTRFQPLSARLSSLLNTGKYNLILHPKSQGSAREWGLTNFVELIRQLDKSLYHVFISGTAKERELLHPLFEKVDGRVTDITGQMNLSEFISFIAQADGLVANSTGPLHIAAAVGINAFGIYPPMRPIHPGRWAPLGQHAQTFVLDKYCIDCKNNSHGCHCIMEIDPAAIKTALDKTLVNQH